MALKTFGTASEVTWFTTSYTIDLHKTIGVYMSNMLSKNPSEYKLTTSYEYEYKNDKRIFK